MTLQQFFEKLRNDPDNYFDNSEDIMKEFKHIVDDLIAPKITSIFTKFPEHKLE